MHLARKLPVDRMRMRQRHSARHAAPADENEKKEEGEKGRKERGVVIHARAILCPLSRTG